MKTVKQNLTRQLVAIAIIICGIIYISLGLLLPKALLPIYEKSIYQYLRQPLDVMKSDLTETELSDVAYLYVTSKNEIVTSNNLSSLIKIEPQQILGNIDASYGKFKHGSKTYYYNSIENAYGTKIAITNNDYIIRMKNDILYTTFPILLTTFMLIGLLFMLWSRKLVKKIEKLKEKIDNLDNDEYVNDYKFDTDDELNALSQAIDTMKLTLKEQDEYKNQMYQSISHDLKTPLSVINSYIEAIEDEVMDRSECSRVIKEQLKKLEQKVHSLLYLNKLNYIKDTLNYQNETTDIREILKSSIEQFKVIRPDIKFSIYVQNKTLFRGTRDMWETIIDNMLNNFTRYANKIIKVTIKNNSIIFYNDGPNIDPDILKCIFTPYTKGIKGQFGLGLSIIKKSLSLFDYTINVTNEKIGVTFLIK